MGKCQDVHHEDWDAPEDYQADVIDFDGVARCWGCVEDAEFAYNQYLGELADVA